MMFERISLKHILFFGFTLISIIPVIFLTAWVQQSALDKEVAAVQEKHLLVARNLTGALSRYVTDVEAGFRLAAQNLFHSKQLRNLDELLKGLYFRHVCLIDSTGRISKIIMVKGDRVPDRISAQVLARLAPFIKTAKMNPGKNYFSDLMRDGNSMPTVFLLRALSNRQLVIGALATNYMVEIQKTIAFGRRGHAAIVDRNGLTIAHPVPEWRTSMKDISFLPPVAKMKKGETGVSTFYTPAMQADMVAGYTIVPRVGWGVMVPQPFEELVERVADVRLIAFGLTLLGVTIAGFIGWWLAAFLARPIQAVAASARRVAQGKLLSRVAVLTGVVPRELRDLSGSFNLMVDEVSSKNKALEETAARLEEAQSIAHLGNWEWDVQTGSLWCSDEVYRIFGFKPQEFQATWKVFLEHIHAEDRVSVMQLMTQAASNQQSNSVDHRVILFDETERIVRHSAQLIAASTDQHRRVIGTVHDITEQKRYEEQLVHQANFDELTDLPNRTLLLERLSQAMFSSKRAGKQAALLFIDLDHFKVVNDSLGHILGDQLLKHASERLSDCIREVDTAARLGGDEFAVVLTHTEGEECAAIAARRIIARLSEPYLIDGLETFVSASIGISVYPSDAKDAVGMLRNADIAMFRAKKLGRTTYQFFTSDMDAVLHQRMLMTNDLRNAMENNEFSVHYQPIIDIQTGVVTSAEALLRWFHPERGSVSPVEFIPLAEDTSLIGPIGEWVLRSACNEVKAWHQLTQQPLRVSVNLSTRQLQLGLSRGRIEAILKEYGISGDCLIFEITESLIMDDVEQAIAWLKSVKELGIRISVDDFGTGYSSLSYLKRLPVDVVKIDRSFIADVTENPDDASLVEAIITLAHSLNLQVVAEGVETKEQLEFLRALKCELVQGYYFSRAVSRHDFSALLQDWDPVEKSA